MLNLPWFSCRWPSTLWGQLVFTHRLVRSLQMASGQFRLRGTQTGNQVCLVMAGNEPPQFPSTVNRLRAPSEHDSLCPNKRCSDLNQTLCRVSRTLASHSSSISRLDSSAFRVLLLRRLWLPLPPFPLLACVAVSLTSLAHRAGCAEAGDCWPSKMRFGERSNSRVSRSRSYGQNKRDGEQLVPASDGPR